VSSDLEEFPILRVSAADSPGAEEDDDPKDKESGKA
jgi:hypothetical protein